MSTLKLVAYFKAGYTVAEVAAKAQVDVLTVEKAIRRWMLVKEGK